MEGHDQPLPDLVNRAEELAATHGFSNSCDRRTGALLRTLATGSSRVLELGSGLGVGTAWIASGMRAGGELVSVELDRNRHGALQSLFTENDKVTLLQCDWRGALRFGPFDLAFVDVGEAKDEGVDEVIEAMNPGGLILLDDFTPGPRYRGELDERWRIWMQHPRLQSCELLTDEGVAAILASRSS